MCVCRSVPQVMVVSSEGYFYSYNIDLENGGECSLMKQYSYVSRSYRICVKLSLLCLAIPIFSGTFFIITVIRWMASFLSVHW